MYIPPPKGLPLPENVQFVTVGEELVLLDIPPPSMLLANMQPEIVGEELLLYMPPPALLVNVQFVTTGDEDSLYIHPPSFAELPENVQFVTVGETPELYIPPPG